MNFNGIKHRIAENGHLVSNASITPTGDAFSSQAPSENAAMKQRPATSIRVASKAHVFGLGASSGSQGGAHFGQTAGQQTLRYQSRQFGANRTNEHNIGGQQQAQLIHVKSALGAHGGVTATHVQEGSGTAQPQ